MYSFASDLETNGSEPKKQFLYPLASVTLSSSFIGEERIMLRNSQAHLDQSTLKKTPFEG